MSFEHGIVGEDLEGAAATKCPKQSMQGFIHARSDSSKVIHRESLINSE
jgi:hypothetical protein